MIKLNVDSYSLVPKYSLLLISSLVLVSLALTACGQKGSLYLPHKGQTIDNPNHTSEQTKEEHQQDEFLIPGIDEDIQHRIQKMKTDPNDY